MTMRITRISLLSALLTGLCGLPPQAATEPVEDRIARVEHGVLPAIVVEGTEEVTFGIEAMMQELGVPGVGLAVIDRGQIAWVRGYGRAVVEGAPLTTETLFQAASVSKPVTAIAALSLVEAGRIDLDEDVNTYLRSWKVPENELTRTEKVTLRRLLSHTAGVSAFNVDEGASAQEAPTLLQILNGEPPAETDPVTVVAVPGSAWEYSSEGYAIVQQLLVDVEGKPFPEILREQVLDPLEMRHSTFRQPPPPAWLAQAATGHVGAGEPLADKGRVYRNMAAGGLWTTPSDLARFILAIQESLAGESNAVLSRAMTETMLKPVMEGCGLGLGIAGEGEDRTFGHKGHNPGFFCTMQALARGGRGLVVMANSNKAVPLLEGIAYAVAREYGWPSRIAPQRIARYLIPRETLAARYAGRYVVAGDYVVSILLAGDTLRISHLEGEDALLPVSDTEFYQQRDGIKLTFILGAEGPAEAITLMDGRLRLERSE